MKKRKILQHEVHSSSEVARYFGALSEDFQSRVVGIAEIILRLHEKIDRKFNDMHARFENHMEILKKISDDIAIIKREIGILK